MNGWRPVCEAEADGTAALGSRVAGAGAPRPDRVILGFVGESVGVVG